MNDKLAVSDRLAVVSALREERRDLIKSVAMDIGKEVAHHIEMMYPEAVKAASSTFLLSVRNCTCNEIMSAMEIKNAPEWLRFRQAFRRHIRAAYKNIRRQL